MKGSTMKKFLTAIIAITIGLLMSACTSNPETVQYQEFASDAQIIDVRTETEFGQGHLPDAINIPHTTILEGKGYAKLDKNKPVVLYCRSGNRAGLALEHLQAQGFTNIINVGGINDLVIKQDNDD